MEQSETKECLKTQQSSKEKDTQQLAKELEFIQDHPALKNIQLPNCPNCKHSMKWCSGEIDDRLYDLPVGHVEDGLHFGYDLLPIICFDCSVFTCICRWCVDGSIGSIDKQQSDCKSMQICRFISRTKFDKSNKKAEDCKCERCFACFDYHYDTIDDLSKLCKNRYYYLDTELYFINLDDYECLTGPDGGYYHLWQCPTCKKQEGISDK